MNRIRADRNDQGIIPKAVAETIIEEMSTPHDTGTEAENRDVKKGGVRIMKRNTLPGSGVTRKPTVMISVDVDIAVRSKTTELARGDTGVTVIEVADRNLDLRHGHDHGHGRLAKANMKEGTNVGIDQALRGVPLGLPDESIPPRIRVVRPEHPSGSLLRLFLTRILLKH